MTSEQVAWLRGFANGLAEAHRLNHDDQAIRHAMRAAGVTVEQLRAADVYSSDLVVLEDAQAKKEGDG